jgi:hypothetical protein
MAAISLGIANPTHGDLRQIGLKQATIQVQPVTIDTPATTPEQNSPSEEVMTGKKVFSLERPMDKARELAAKLTLEEQVRDHFLFCLDSRYLRAGVFRTTTSITAHWVTSCTYKKCLKPRNCFMSACRCTLSIFEVG